MGSKAWGLGLYIYSLGIRKKGKKCVRVKVKVRTHQETSDCYLTRIQIWC